MFCAFGGVMGLHDLPHARRPFVGVLVLSAQFEHLALHRSDHLRIGRVAVLVPVLVRIGPEVVELPRGRRDAVVRAGHAEPVAVEEDQLVTVVADAHVRRAYFVLGPVTVIHAAGPLLRRVAREVAPETAALRLLRRFGSGIVGQQRCEIDVGDDVPVAGSGRNLLRVADHEGHAQRFLVHDPLVEESVLSEEVTLIRDVDHDRILRQPLFVERAEQTADVVVDRRGAAQVVAYEFLVDGPAVGDRIPLDAAERQFGVVGPPVLRIGVGLVPAPCHRFERLARERAEALRRVLVSEFRTLYDSLRVSGSYTLDENGRQVLDRSAGEQLPDLPNLLRTKWLAEDWDELYRLVAADTLIADKQEVLAMMKWEGNPDTREWRIRMKYPKAYERMRRVIYPQMRAVDFRFNLHRRGMKQDTVYTTEVDAEYMHAVELLKKRRYEEALTILRPYEDRNTALAYMSLGYDAAAYRILRAEPDAASTPDIQYMLAILASRLGDEEQAVTYFLRSVELRESLKFRGNLDPEISRLIRKYGLFREDFE